MIKTKAFVFKNIKTKDNTHVLKVYTEEHGLVSFIVTVSKSKGKIKSSYLLPLAFLEISFDYHANKDIQKISDVSVLPDFSNIHDSIAKQSIVYFLCEVLSKSIKEIEKNHRLFEFIYDTLSKLNRTDTYFYFSIQFLIELSLHLGILPEDNYSSQEPIFSLIDGKFISETSASIHGITTTESEVLHELLNENQNISLSKDLRNKMVTVLINYFELHIPEFGKVKSLEVLEEVFT